jgi:hypothetical protein
LAGPVLAGPVLAGPVLAWDAPFPHTCTHILHYDRVQGPDNSPSLCPEQDYEAEKLRINKRIRTRSRKRKKQEMKSKVKITIVI